MTDNDSPAILAPKKLKLTLKLSSSSSSSSSSPSPVITSQLSSSIPASPVKPFDQINSTRILSDLLPSGLGNLKGRGRPKKAAASKTTETLAKEEEADCGSGNTTPQITSTSTQPSNPTATPNEYAADLKSFVASMKSFKCRSWSLNRPANLETKNLAGYSVNFSCGLWCTDTSELGSGHLRSAETSVMTTITSTTSGSKDSAVEIACQCGKVFNTQSKYKKHLKTHEKSSDAVDIAATVPTISLKIKLNTASINNQ